MAPSTGTVADVAVLSFSTESPFPPSFAGNPWTYGFALFSLTLIAAISLAMLLRYLFEYRAFRAAWAISEVDRPAPLPLASPHNVFQAIKACLLLTIFIGAAPDVLVLFAWGEASHGTMETLFLIDRLGDGSAIIPFLLAACLSEWAYQVVPQALIRDTLVGISRPRWKTFKDGFKIAGVTLVIAIGVTIAKAKVGV